MAQATKEKIQTRKTTTIPKQPVDLPKSWYQAAGLMKDQAKEFEAWGKRVRREWSRK